VVCHLGHLELGAADNGQGAMSPSDNSMLIILLTLLGASRTLSRVHQEYRRFTSATEYLYLR
jgi:hypothetical protein